MTAWRKEPSPDHLGDEWLLDLEPQRQDPAHQFVGEQSEHGPGSIRVEVAR
jgi:hypothetical protein